MPGDMSDDGDNPDDEFKPTAKESRILGKTDADFDETKREREADLHPRHELRCVFVMRMRTWRPHRPRILYEKNAKKEITSVLSLSFRN